MDVLAGITVIEFAQGLSGPLCAMFLGDLGARVIKVEPLHGDWARGLEPHIGQHSAVFLALNRQKESLAVYWSCAQGREVIQRLAARADVCIADVGDERAGERAPDYATLAAQNPALIYGAITPFGERGPWADKVGSELVVQAASGYPRYLGEHGQEPVRLGADVASTAAGMFLLQGILASLLERRRSGLGQRVAVSQLGSLLSLKTIQIAAQQNPDTWEGYHCWGPYDPPDTGWRTRDRPIVFSFGEFTGGGRDKQSRWPEFCQAIGLAHLVSDARFRKDGANSTGLGADAAKFRALYEEAFRRYTSEELIELIRQLGGAAYPYHTYETLFADPQAEALRLLREIPGPEGALRAVKAPWNFSNADMDVRRAPPDLGDATGAILSELGYSMAQQQALFQDGIVAGRGPEERSGEPPRLLATSRPTGHPAASGAQGPLQGIRVVDISAVGVGPVTGLLLAELGADVVKVE
ncbi:MAG: CoA transferase, partial [Candidatus Entotheonellia bacterium]